MYFFIFFLIIANGLVTGFAEFKALTFQSTNGSKIAIYPEFCPFCSFSHCALQSKDGSCYQINNNKLIAITAIPLINPPIAMWCSPYSSAVGNNSSSDM